MSVGRALETDPSGTFVLAGASLGRRVQRQQNEIIWWQNWRKACHSTPVTENNAIIGELRVEKIPSSRRRSVNSELRYSTRPCLTQALKCSCADGANDKYRVEGEVVAKRFSDWSRKRGGVKEISCFVKRRSLDIVSGKDGRTNPTRPPFSA